MPPLCDFLVPPRDFLVCKDLAPFLPRGQNPAEDKTLPCFSQFFRLSPKLGWPHSMGEAGLGGCGHGDHPGNYPREKKKENPSSALPAAGETSLCHIMGTSPSPFFHIPCAPQAGSRLEFCSRGAGSPTELGASSSPPRLHKRPRGAAAANPALFTSSSHLLIPAGRAAAPVPPIPGWTKPPAVPRVPTATSGHGDTPCCRWVQRPEPQHPPEGFWKSKFGGVLEKQIRRGWVELGFLPRDTPRCENPPSAAPPRAGSTQNQLPATPKSAGMEQRTPSTVWGSCQRREEKLGVSARVF